MSRIKNLHQDAIVGSVVVVFALFLLAASLLIPPAPPSASMLGPSVLPVLISSVLGLAGLVLALRGLQHGGSAPREPALLGEAMPEEFEKRELDEEAQEKPGQVKRFVIVTLILLAYILVFIPVGYLLSTFAFLAAASMYIDPKRWVRNLVFAALFAVVVYVAFTRGLQVQLPPGLLG